MSTTAATADAITLNQAWQTLQKIEGVQIEPVYGPPRAGRRARLAGRHHAGRGRAGPRAALFF